MGFRRRDLTGKQKLGVFVYFIFALITFLATGSSIDTSFSFSQPGAYIIAFAIVAFMGLSLGKMKEMLQEGRVKVSALSAVFLVFFSLWGISVLTNAHYVLRSLKGGDIWKETIGWAITSLDEMGDEQSNAAHIFIQNYQSEGARKINDFYNEVRNPINFGKGRVSDSLRKDVARFLGEDDISSISGSITNRTQAEKYADAMSKKMWAILHIKVNGMYEKAKILSLCRDSIKTDSIIKGLYILNNYSTDFQSPEFEQKISDAHLFYQNTQNCFTNGLLPFTQLSASDSTAIGINRVRNKLEFPVPAIKLKKIDELLPFVRKYPKSDPGEYSSALIYSLIIAILIDLAGFVILYSIVLKNED